MAEKAQASGTSTKEILGESITALVLFTHAIVFFQIVICSKNMVVAFSIPTKNIGIYLSKLYSLRTLLMSVGGATEYGIYQVIKITVGNGNNNGDKDKNIRKYVSVVSFTSLTITRLIFLIFLYYPETAAFRNYIVLIIGAFFVGSFQISAFSLAPQVSALSWLSVYLSGIFAFIIQAIMDMCWSKRPSLTFKIQSWISLILSIISVGSWIFNLFFLDEVFKNQNGTQAAQQSNGSCKLYVKSCKFPLTVLLSQDVKTIVILLIDELELLCCHCKCLKTTECIKLLISDLSVITCPEQIQDEILVTIDLVILGLVKIKSCPESELMLIRQLALVLRIKQSLCKAPCSIQVQATVSVQTCKKEEVPTCTESTGQDSDQNNQTSIYYSISPFLMFGTGSLVKDFLFPGVIPYGLLERDKCHLINLIVIIFLSVGPVTIFVLDKVIKEFKSEHIYYHGFWICMIPEIVIFFISLSAIHSKEGSSHKIRSSRWRLFLMSVVLLTCYGFLETVNIVGVPNTVRKTFPDLIAINNIFGKFVRYFVYKLSVGYNKTRINTGFVLPNFRPPEPIPDTFCYWFKGAFSNGWKDLVGDFKMGIKPYLTVSEEPIVKSVPILSSVYPDMLG